MALPRESAFMPTIKCSSCGDQVEISMMGEHVCLSSAAAPELPPLPSNDNAGSFARSAPVPDPKPARMAPPRVDTGAASKFPNLLTTQFQYANTQLDRQFLGGQGQMTPISISTASRSVSPKTPAGVRSDDYFQPQIASDPGAISPRAIKRPGGYGGFDEPDAYEPVSPYQSSPKQQQGNFLQRMDTMARGPFEAERRPSAASNMGRPPPLEAERRPSAVSNMASSPQQRLPSRDQPRPESPKFSPTLNDSPKKTLAVDPPARPRSPSNGFAFLGDNHTGIAPPNPPKVPRKNGYGGFGPPGQSAANDFEPQPFGANRSGTFPRSNVRADAPVRTPSAPGSRPDNAYKGAAAQDPTGHNRQPSMGPDRSRAPPPRTSLLRPSTSGRDGPSINLADEFGVGNPYHSPSDSASSSSSTFSSGPSNASTQSSSQASPAKARPVRRNPSDTTNFDNLMNDLQTSMSDFRPSASKSPVSPRLPDSNGHYNQFPGQPHGTSPPRSTSPRPSSRRRGDPAAQTGRGSCKACGDPIKGKSISSADGRLTGRYHKACFVCTTCTQPFSSAEFYVMGDKPYCELHYHKLNGSLCGSCGRGIEGQYLEDEGLIKYHVGCFRCGDCGMSLSNGYFEVDGKSYCERDAWKRVQQPWMANGNGTGPVEPEPPGRPMARSPAPQPMGLPPRPGGGPGPGGPRPGMGGPRPAIGLPRGQRLAPGVNLGPMPRMNKRMTRLGMMGA